MTTTVEKLWSNSGDSHAMGEAERWKEILPPDLFERMPRSVKDADGEFETIHVDGRKLRRKLPTVEKKKDASGKTATELGDARGATTLEGRLADLDREGVWGEVVYPSLGLWETLITDRAMVAQVNRLQNEYLATEVAAASGHRLVPAGSVPMLDIDDSVSEVTHMADLGLKCVYMPSGVPAEMPALNRDDWEPFWAALEETGMVLGVHIGTDPALDNDVVRFRGPGGAILNYVETTYDGQRVATQLVASGALDRHPGLKVLISEGGSTWVPFLGDRMNEAYRQHSNWVRPMLSAMPKEILYRQVYTSFQHDASAPAAMWAMGYQNILWGSDYPHVEGTFGHTQQTLHELFDDLDQAISHRIRVGAFRELFPHVSEPPES
jgi:predicted TIM-barrel fold metal-dependent hydrolase